MVITLQEKVLPKSLAVKELVSGLYEIEGMIIILYQR